MTTIVSSATCAAARPEPRLVIDLIRDKEVGGEKWSSLLHQEVRRPPPRRSWIPAVAGTVDKGSTVSGGKLYVKTVFVDGAAASRPGPELSRAKRTCHITLQLGRRVEHD